MKQLISLAAGLLLLAAPGAAAQPASPGMASPIAMPAPAPEGAPPVPLPSPETDGVPPLDLPCPTTAVQEVVLP
ncbi:MAG: hypothetical protein KH295_07645 [Clostridiaceae bacterium]|nr:hypothetical protein [Clostridiaceae bacterium]